MSPDELKLIHEMSAFIVNNCKNGKARRQYRNQLLEKAQETLEYNGKKSRDKLNEQNNGLAGNTAQ